MQRCGWIFAEDKTTKRKIIFFHSIYAYKIYRIIYIFLPPKHILQILPDVLFTQPREVGVDIPRRSDIRMPQPLLDVFQLPSVVVENARRAVTDIMETHIGCKAPAIFRRFSCILRNFMV